MHLPTPTLGAGTWVIDGQPEFSEYSIEEVPVLQSIARNASAHGDGALICEKIGCLGDETGGLGDWLGL